MPKTLTPRTATINVRLGENTKRTVERYAKAREMTVGEFVRYVLRVYMDTTAEEERDD